ncbi:helix-turn-helix domain-containing protein [Pseudoalteromonas luteoviolacea]|uniref:helix-turn-helix domain-containing protein n=1 Tax=Pseudoalteromonas luteoviolacea TaxID=43657 RepID=UPI001B396501|nr:helix-turn-helix domain-containing protein [Pseudoalteromonas luteoviolacea]MBQ4813250.1 helix-turn-helix domain-containing protein [Pseudoalteromonas luteoviolacea]
MEQNNQLISGVLHQTKSAPNYTLRRYFPSPQLSSLVEQYWLVNWDLPEDSQHVQRNLPDPNCHLTFLPNKCEFLGPVSKVYDYTMHGQNGIIGVKFKLGALACVLPNPIEHYMDTVISMPSFLHCDLAALSKTLSQTDNDKARVHALEQALEPLCGYVKVHHVQQLSALIERIKSNDDIYTVEDLALQSGVSKRTLQRQFKQYIGLSPKYLIRKYRLHAALTLLERHPNDIHHLVNKLDYADQAHLIKDFKNILGMTPGAYIDDI